MKPYLFPIVLTVAVGACVTDQRATISGTWTAQTSVDEKACPRCQGWVGLDLFENRQGIVTGIMATVSSSSFDLATDASYVVGTRWSDSLNLVALFPCDSGATRVHQRFRGHISVGGDTINGEFRARLFADSVRSSFALTRGTIDSAMIQGINWLVKACRAAA